MQSDLTCELCMRPVQYLTVHHLIPRTRHKNKRNKKNFSRAEVRRRVAMICSPCHRNIHALLSEKELEYDYNTIERLRAHSEVKKYIEWVKSKPWVVTIRTRRSNRRKG